MSVTATKDPTPTASHRRAGVSLIAFGVTSLVGSLVYGLFTDRLVIDFGPVIIIALGVAVKGGGRLSVKWAFGIMLLYLLVTVGMIVWVMGDGNLRRGPATFAGAAAAVRSLPLLIPSAVWEALNVVLLWRVLVELRKSDRVKRGECPDCGYDLRGTRAARGDRCPECGRSTADLPPPEADVVGEKLNRLAAPPAPPRL